MSIYESLENALKESFSYTLHDKLIFISGYLDGDSENEDLLNFVNYLLYSEKENMSFPKLDFSIPFSDNFLNTEESYKKVTSPVCKTCIHYKNDNVLTGSFCANCRYFSQLNSTNNYQKVN